MTIKPCRDKWKGTMSDRERFSRQMHFQAVDRCFNMEFGYWDENFREWPMFVENGIRNNDQADIFLAFDRIEVFAPKVWLNPCFERRVIEEKKDVNVIMNGDGLLAEVPKSGAGSSIPHYIKPTVVTPDDWRRCKEERLRLDDPQRKLDTEALRRRYAADRDYPVGIHCGSMIGRIRDMLTFEGICYAVYDYPEMVEDMVETACQMVELALDQALGVVDFDYASGWEDICFNHGPILAIDFFENVVAPRYRRIGAKLKAAGIDVWYTDCDGDVRPLLPIFLDAGINCLFPYEVNSCVHPGALLDQYPQLRIMGGVDKMQLKKGPDAIRAYLETLVPYVERGGYIPFCDHRCPPDVAQEHYLYYLDLKERMFGLRH